MCMHMVYKLFLGQLSSNRLPIWIDKKISGGTREEKCHNQMPNVTQTEMNETNVEHHDCYEKINQTQPIIEELHRWLDGGLVPFTGILIEEFQTIFNEEWVVT